MSYPAERDGRFKRVGMRAPVLQDLMTEGKEHHFEIINGLPPDAQFRRFYVEPTGDMEDDVVLWAIFAHPDWPIVEGGDEIPTIEVMHRALDE